jgi:hypothetical protein
MIPTLRILLSNSRTLFNYITMPCGIWAAGFSRNMLAHISSYSHLFASLFIAQGIPITYQSKMATLTPVPVTLSKDKIPTKKNIRDIFGTFLTEK